MLQVCLPSDIAEGIKQRGVIQSEQHIFEDVFNDLIEPACASAALPVQTPAPTHVEQTDFGLTVQTHERRTSTPRPNMEDAAELSSAPAQVEMQHAVPNPARQQVQQHPAAEVTRSASRQLPAPPRPHVEAESKASSGPGARAPAEESAGLHRHIVHGSILGWQRGVLDPRLQLARDAFQGAGGLAVVLSISTEWRSESSPSAPLATMVSQSCPALDLISGTSRDKACQTDLISDSLAPQSRAEPAAACVPSAPQEPREVHSVAAASGEGKPWSVPSASCEPRPGGVTCSTAPRQTTIVDHRLRIARSAFPSAALAVSMGPRSELITIPECLLESAGTLEDQCCDDGQASQGGDPSTSTAAESGSSSAASDSLRFTFNQMLQVAHCAFPSSRSLTVSMGSDSPVVSMDDTNVGSLCGSLSQPPLRMDTAGSSASNSVVTSKAPSLRMQLARAAFPNAAELIVSGPVEAGSANSEMAVSQEVPSTVKTDSASGALGAAPFVAPFAQIASDLTPIFQSNMHDDDDDEDDEFLKALAAVAQGKPKARAEEPRQMASHLVPPLCIGSPIRAPSGYDPSFGVGMSEADRLALEEMLGPPKLNPHFGCAQPQMSSSLLTMNQLKPRPEPQQFLLSPRLDQDDDCKVLPTNRSILGGYDACNMSNDDLAALQAMLSAAPKHSLFPQHSDEDLRALHEMQTLPTPRFEPPPPRPAVPPVLPERLQPYVAPTGPPVYSDESEYPDPALARRSWKFSAAALVCGAAISLFGIIPASWFVWTWLALHVLGVIFFTSCDTERTLVVASAVLALHGGVAVSESLLWCVGWQGYSNVGPWSVIVIFACMLYLHSFWSECMILPPDCVTSISFFFPTFPAFNAAVVLNALEFFLEWRYLPDWKLWWPVLLCGLAMMTAGISLIHRSSRVAGRNYWASCRDPPEDEENPEDYVGLEILDRRVVQEGAYRWERHPAYLGAFLLGVGVELVLCNPIMLILVSFVLWASLLYVSIEEEKELYEEFPGAYANYCTLTSCWLPMFNTFLANAAFNREMSENAEKEAEELDDELVEEDEEFEDDEEGEEEEQEELEDHCMPGWAGVPRGGSLWNRQFRDPWRFG
mmetsp:Transcript_9602/g.25588  ORF Transcript_9602/g.25588 Transcript_9602/m.25588 type:complete len:1102 (+) Transcript_9602:125-3430(+)